MEDLRQSGQIEQDADVVMLLHRPEAKAAEEGRTTFTGMDKIVLAKQRNGPAGEFIAVWFDGPMSVYKARHMRGLQNVRRKPTPQKGPCDDDNLADPEATPNRESEQAQA